MSSFLVQDSSDEEPEKVAEVSEDSTDKAIGEISPIFTKQEDFAAGSIAAMVLFHNNPSTTVSQI